DLATVLVDTNPIPAGTSGPQRPWEPRPEPSDVELLANSIAGVPGLPPRAAKRFVRAAQRPRESAAHAVEVAEGIGGVAWQLLNPAPTLPLNQEIGPHPRVLWAHDQLQHY